MTGRSKIEPIHPQIKILRMHEFDEHTKVREADGRRLQFAHLCIYKIVGTGAYYIRYVDHTVAHLSEGEQEKWLLRHMKDKANELLDQADSA
jgi:hypothetical protein